MAPGQYHIELELGCCGRAVFSPGNNYAPVVYDRVGKVVSLAQRVQQYALFFDWAP